MKLITTTLALALAVTSLNAATEFDLRKGIDLTATNYVTPSMLNQLVDAGTISSTNKGGVIRRSANGTSYWPDITLNPRYTNFLWLDTYTSPGTLKQYVCCGDAYTNWVAATVTPGSITSAEILNFTIQAIDIGTNAVAGYAIQAGAVDANKIADNGIIAGKLSASSVGKGTFAFGAITGGDITNKTITYTNIADGTIGPDQMQNNAIGTLQLTNGAVTTDKIAATNITQDLIRYDAIGTLQITNGAVTSNKLAAGAINFSNVDTNTSYGIARVWGVINPAFSLAKGLGVASIFNDGVAATRVTFTTPFADTNYCVVVTPLFKSASAGRMGSYYSNQVDSVWLRFSTDGGADANSGCSFIILNF